VKLKVIACGVFEPELTALAGESPNEIRLHFLDAGLHSTPDKLREQVQGEIDRSVGQGFQGIIVSYGLCGRGTSSLVARDCPIVIPRVHDCMTLFLGSREEYRKQFAENPGTFYVTPGWYEKKMIAGRPVQERRVQDPDVRKDERFADLSERFGAENAAYILHFHDSWKRNYTRAAFIDTGFGDSHRYASYAQDMAREFGWRYERLAGDTSLLQDLLAGRWDDSRICVLRPGQRSVLTGDETIFAAIDLAGPATGSEAAPEEPSTEPPDVAPTCGVVQQAANPMPEVAEAERVVAQPTVQLHAPRPSSEGGSGTTIGLGIDAGGTYTDCVLYDLRSNLLLSKAKALTTHYDLMVGIENALDHLDLGDTDRIGLVALSTTLATNSIVEGKGGRPGAIILSAAPGSNPSINWSVMRTVGGQMGIDGIELEPPDRAEVAHAVQELLAEGVDAFAISGYASVKNPEHEVLVKEIVQSLCDLPVVCGHELSSRLNYVSRANTAILNARLLPVVRQLLDAVQSSLDRRGIRAHLMVVKGDGSLVNRKTALERPVETVLSGPAASVSGAKHLTGLRDAIILDMGGTTTDTAVIEDGLVRISPHGARVGGWLTSVEAADIATTGLGGDSYLSFTGDRRLLIGPRRVVPLSYLCSQYPAAREMLLAIDPDAVLERSSPEVLDFFLLARPDYIDTLDSREQQTVEALREGPLSRGALAARIGALAPNLVRPKRLETLGVVQRAALTPTDLLHVNGQFAAWDVTAAQHALTVFASLYGLDSEEMARRILDRITERLAAEVIAREHEDIGDDPEKWPEILKSAFRGSSGSLHVQLSYDRPIVAIGAPVRPFFPAVGRSLGAQVVIPEHAEVANAIGAVASEVVVREQAVVRPGEIANYVVHSRAGRTEHENLQDAVEAAKSETASLARQRALQSGTRSHDVRYRVDERRAYSSAGDEVLVEVLVEATVNGRPALQ
jgi:N-methylhydantoinase A/oxoprolinase/acetone carboxylase beta subunit